MFLVQCRSSISTAWFLRRMRSEISPRAQAPSPRAPGTGDLGWTENRRSHILADFCIPSRFAAVLPLRLGVLERASPAQRSRCGPTIAYPFLPIRLNADFFGRGEPWHLSRDPGPPPSSRDSDRTPNHDSGARPESVN